MKHKFFTLFRSITLALLVVSCQDTTETPSNQDEVVEIVILHTNDEHAKLENFAKLKRLVEKEKAANARVLMISAGDIFSGSPFVDFADEPGKPMVDIMNRIGYDLMVIGNHDFDYGLDILKDRIEDASFPFILSNVTTNGLLEEVAPYHVFNFEDIGVSFAVVGFIQTGTNGLPSTSPSNVASLGFTAVEDLRNSFVGLKSEHQALVALTHLGVNRDRNFARSFPEFDIIIGGHSHTPIPGGIYEGRTLITQAGSDMRFVGKTILGFRNGELVRRNSQLISLDSFNETDGETQALIASFLSNPILETVITDLPFPISGPPELGCLMSDALRVGLEVDLAVQNIGGIRLNQLQAGPVKISDVLSLDPFRNHVFIMELTKQEVQALLETRTRFTGSIDLFVSGMSYSIIRNAAGQYLGMDMRLDGGKEWENGKKYRVAMNSFIGTTFNFQREDRGEEVFIQTTDLLIRFMQNSPGLDYRDCNRVQIQMGG
ncbi:MAG: bifunctional metallophosphatase/5'-nucleotidase [Mongoliitalea sp.]